MSLRSNDRQWGSVAKFFHWTVALLIIGNGIFGLCLGCEMYLIIRRIWPGRHKLVPAEADKEV